MPQQAAAPVDWRQRFTWIALAFVPSSLMLGVTTYIATDIASAPLFWVVPLALYLLSFIIAFARHRLLPQSVTLKAQAIGILAVSTLVVLVLIFARGGSVLLVASVHLLTFFVTAIVCHSELARRRPGVEGLTGFYFCMSIGGAAGGIFNALIAPVAFTSDYEYYLALAAACALRGFIAPAKFNARDAVFPLLLGLAVAMVAYRSGGSNGLSLTGRLAILVPASVALYSFAAGPGASPWALPLSSAVRCWCRIRSMCCTPSAASSASTKSNASRTAPRPRSSTAPPCMAPSSPPPACADAPLAYYARSGPVGQALALAGPRHQVGVIGLGTGALACYRRPGEDWTFFEIDAAVVRIARDPRYFHYLEDCGGGTRILLGDGRLSLKGMPDRHFDLLVVDAFSSDAVPVHLLTREAMSLYLRKLKPHGIVLFNISNEYLDLRPVLATVIAATAPPDAINSISRPAPNMRGAPPPRNGWRSRRRMRTWIS